MGEGLSSVMRCLFRRIRPSVSSNNSENNISSSKVIEGGGDIMTKNTHKNKQQPHSVGVSISICFMILISYITVGVILFHKIQSWDILESLYFCFSSLLTIGFGDLSPTGNLAQYFASGYILIGMAVVAMSFSLIQTELIFWLRKIGVQDTVVPSPNHDDIALITVSMTPSKSWQRPHGDIVYSNRSGSNTNGGNNTIENSYNSLPRRTFQRNTPIRRSAGIMENHVEYFVPRSVSEFNLTGVGVLTSSMPPPPVRRTPISQSLGQQHHIQKNREKMVTFEDESKCPHGTPRKGSILGDVFMWREGGWDEQPVQYSSNIIKV